MNQNRVERSAYYRAMDRCNNKNRWNYKNYGGRGIRFKFTSFLEFYEHIGPRPSTKHSLDRIDNDGNYEVGNIKWSTPKEQQRNRRNNSLYTINGETRPLVEWCEIYNIKYKLVKDRLYRPGWDIEKALTKTVAAPKYTINGKTMSLTEWCKVYNKNYHTVYSRLKIRGWDAERALTEKIRPKSKRNG